MRQTSEPASARIPVISFGEIVWDAFPGQTVLGGAPLNVAYHLHALGWPTAMISRVGEDQYGKDALARIAGLGIPLEAIQRDAELPTGLVLVTLGPDNEPSYEIVHPAAWDAISAAEIPAALTAAPFHLVFGTLAQRSATSRATLRTLLEKAQTLFYDVNLRPPYDLPELVRDSLSAAHVVKLTRQELAQLNDWFLHAPEEVPAMGRALIERFDVEVLAVTDGDKGASLISRDEALDHPGFPVTAADPVGSGDAFFSALIIGYLTHRPLQECLVRANQLGAFVASQPGATPEYTRDPFTIGTE